VSRIYGVPYGTIPEWVLDADISDRAVRLWVVLDRYAGQNDRAYPGRRATAERMRCSVDSVDRAMAELVAIDAVIVHAEYRNDRSQTTNSYYLWPAKPDGETEGGKPQDSGPPAAPVRPPRRSDAAPKGKEPQRKEPQRNEKGVSDYVEPSHLPAVVETSEHLEVARLLCTLLADSLERRGERVNGKATSGGWLSDMEALLRLDGRSPEAVAKVIRWLDTGTDETAGFWRANIRSPLKLRAKWVQMGEQYAQRSRARAGSADAGRATLRDLIESGTL